jgi:ABC-2 type transport system ATP-binding protein
MKNLMQPLIVSVGKLYRRDFSLELDSGVLSLLEPKGAGKSTLMRILAAVTNPSEGHAPRNGADIARPANEVRHVLG